MTNISKRQWGVAVAGSAICAFFSAGFTSALLSSGLGSSDVAGWVQAIGATAGIGIAIWVPYRQRIEQVRDEKIRSYYHALAVVNDLISRVAYLGKIYSEGNRPLAALTATQATVSRRYESLFDRELYTHLPGPIVDKITGMSGSFNGIEAAVAAKASILDNKPHVVLPAHPDWFTGTDPFQDLCQDLDNLFTALEAEANAARS